MSAALIQLEITSSLELCRPSILVGIPSAFNEFIRRCIAYYAIASNQKKCVRRAG